MIKQANSVTRHRFLKTSGIFAGTALISPFSYGGQGYADNTKHRKVAIVKDKSRKMFGLHGMQVAFRGIPNVEVVGLVDGSTSNIEAGRFAVWNLMQAIQEDRQPIANIYDARAALEMIYGVYASHLAKSPVCFPLTDRSHPLEKFIIQ